MVTVVSRYAKHPLGLLVCIEMYHQFRIDPNISNHILKNEFLQASNAKFGPSLCSCYQSFHVFFKMKGKISPWDSKNAQPLRWLSPEICNTWSGIWQTSEQQWIQNSPLQSGRGFKNWTFLTPLKIAVDRAF